MAEDPRSTDFIPWACDPTRTLEERYGIEVLIEQTIGHWRVKHEVKVEPNYEADRLRKKERSLNPAYEPGFSEEDVARVAEIIPTHENFSFTQWNDRPLRDLSFLRFCPGLKKLTSYSNEISDWTPLQYVPQLDELRLSDSQVEDLRPVGLLRDLEVLHVTVDCPWPDLSGWERLEKLRELDYQGNILALREVPRLPALRAAKIHKTGDVIPLRTVADLPEMPELRRLYLENTWRLDGIERYPRLLNLTVYGMFHDLRPLAALQELTHLFVSGSHFESIAPLEHLPQLLGLTVARELPQDYTPLSSLPHLHEVAVELCPASKLEVATLNATLAPWSVEFTVEPPRPLQPLRLRVEKKPSMGGDLADVRGTMPRDWGDDAEMGVSEARWFAREVNRHLGELLGKGWGRCETRYSTNLYPGHEHVTITRPEDLDRLPATVDTLRAIIASARHPWAILLCVDSMSRYERDMDEIKDDDDLEDDEFDAESERQEWEYRRTRERERREFLERLHRYRLRQEQGMPVDPIEFAPQMEQPEEEAAAGEVAGPEHEFDLGTEISLYVSLTETSLFISESERGLAEMLLETKTEPPPPNT